MGSYLSKSKKGLRLRRDECRWPWALLPKLSGISFAVLGIWKENFFSTDNSSKNNSNRFSGFFLYVDIKRKWFMTTETDFVIRNLHYKLN